MVGRIVFHTFPTTGRMHVRKTPAQAYDAGCLLPTVKHGGGFVMTLAAMSGFSAGPIVTLKERITGAWERVTLFGGVRETHSPNSVSCKQQEQGRYGDRFNSCQVIYSQFGLAIHQNDHQARRRFVEWAQNEIAVVPDFHKRILFSDEAHFWLNGYVNKQNCRIWSEANPQVYVETQLHPEKLTVWCALGAGGILLQKR
ncbi:hypothetical protein TNCV_3346641 [Trichonephila clavipes]|nr:hypothetical protein TNCV_3346641 [Trichonephila clavipes]